MFLCIAMLISVAGLATATEVVDLQRGIHDGFELLVIYCDSLPKFSLSYDRVQGQCRLDIPNGTISEDLLLNTASFPSGETIQSIDLDTTDGTILLRLNLTVYLRAYVVGGPPALLLDVSRIEQTNALLPFEYDASGYLQLSGEAERSGKMELALRYLHHIDALGVADQAILHHAGVIQHSLGRWETALETFNRSLDYPELAADARARRAMIYLAMGDTLASGNEWSSHFHKQTPQIEVSAVPTLPVVQQTYTEKTTSSKEQQRKDNNPLPFNIIQAGDGNYIYFGWALVAIGVMFLLRLLLWNRNRVDGYQLSVNDDRWLSADEDPIPASRYPAFRPRHEISRPTSRQPREDKTGTTIPRISPSVARSYSREPDASPKPTPAVDNSAGRGKKMPVNLILEKARSGAGELEIAQEIGIGRDEVAMVINLARLAGRNVGAQ